MDRYNQLVEQFKEFKSISETECATLNGLKEKTEKLNGILSHVHDSLSPIEREQNNRMLAYMRMGVRACYQTLGYLEDISRHGNQLFNEIENFHVIDKWKISPDEIKRRINRTNKMKTDFRNIKKENRRFFQKSCGENVSNGLVLFGIGFNPMTETPITVTLKTYRVMGDFFTKELVVDDKFTDLVNYFNVNYMFIAPPESFISDELFQRPANITKFIRGNFDSNTITDRFLEKYTKTCCVFKNPNREMIDEFDTKSMLHCI